MSADKVVQKIVITPYAGETQDSTEQINAVITDETGAPVVTAANITHYIKPGPVPDNMTIADTNNRLSVMLSTEPGHKNIEVLHGGLSVVPAVISKSSFDIPEEAGTTVTPEQFNKLVNVVMVLLAALQSTGLIEIQRA